VSADVKTVRYYLNIVAEEDAHAEALAALARLEAVVEAAREWVRIYDADRKTAIEWSNGMQRLRHRLADLRALDPPDQDK
jgi:predicted nucleic acid-binding protein